MQIGYMNNFNIFNSVFLGNSNAETAENQA